MSTTKFPPTGNNSQENELVVNYPTHSTFTDFGSSDTYDLPPCPLSVFSDSPENSGIVNLSDTFSPGHSYSSTPSAPLSYEDDEEYDEIDNFLSNPTPTPSDLVLCETSKGGLMLLKVVLPIRNTVFQEMCHNGSVLTEFFAKQGCTLREMK